MAANHCTSNEATIEQVKAALGEIVSLARSAKRIAIESSMETGPNDILEALVNANQVIAEKIGFLSDSVEKVRF